MSIRPGGPSKADLSNTYSTIAKTQIGRQYVSMHDNTVGNIAADGSTDDQAAWNAMLASITAPGVTLTWKGNSAVTAPIAWKTGVGLVGAGPGASVLKPVGNVASVIKNITDYTAAAPMTDVLFADFEIDASGQTVPGGTYNVGYKGFYIQFIKRGHWRNVYVHDTVATGFGVDFLTDCSFTQSVANGCGRLNGGNNPGGAGFGIGAGGSVDESVVIDGCTARNNIRHGIFFERQNSPNNLVSSFAKVVNSHLSGNQNGIVNAGVAKFAARGNTITGSTADGIALKPILTAVLGTETNIGDNYIIGSAFSGVTVDMTGITPGSYDMLLNVHDNEIRDGGGNAFYVNAVDGFTLREIAVRNNMIFNNGYSGVLFTRAGTTGAYVDTLVQGNILRNNGVSGGSAGLKAGVYLNANMTRLLVSGNSASGHSGYGFQTGAVTLTDSKVEMNQWKGNTTGSADSAAATLTNSTVTNNVT